MRTTKPIATISFNSTEYLATKLNELLKAGRISFWAFMPHKPEDDEAGEKPHSHVYVEPSKMLQTDDLRSELWEYDPTHPDKPLGCLKWGSSKFADWYLYALHDKRYLASKGQSRKFHYTHEEFRSSDPDDLLCLARSIDLLSLSPYEDMINAQQNGITWDEYFYRGTVPINLVRSYQEAWFTLLSTTTNRNGRTTHSPKVDELTGEVIEYEQVTIEDTIAPFQ